MASLKNITEGALTELITKIKTVATATTAGLMSGEDKDKLNCTNVAFGTCNTPATTAAKVITLSGNDNWQLTTGAIIGVRSKYTNTATYCTLNVNGTGAKQVWYSGGVLTTSGNLVFGTANHLIYYIYDGAYWCWMGHSYDYNTTYSIATKSYNGLMSNTDKAKLDGLSAPKIYSVSIPASAWVASSSYSTATITLADCTAAWNPLVFLNTDAATADTLPDLMTAYNSIVSCTTGAGDITFKAVGDVPEVDLSLRLYVTGA